jgi:MoxR-like ATPase
MSQENLSPLVLKVKALYQEMGKVIIGYKDIKRALIMALMSDGHVLLESMPGLAKTLMINTLQKAIDGIQAGRIQFDPDLKPTDVKGTRVFNPVLGKYEFAPGPILGDINLVDGVQRSSVNLLLGDELNRGIALTQAALLQPMQERFVDIPGVGRIYLPDPFMVLATINPVEQEGTFALPEAQLDRFMFKLIMGYVSREDEIKILKNTQVHGRGATDKVETVISVSDLMAIRKEVMQIVESASDPIQEYIVDLQRATRPKDKSFANVKDAKGKTFEERIAYGVSPRLSIWVQKGAAVNAWLEGRTAIEPDDVKSVFRDAVRHRLILTQEAVFDNFSADEFVSAVLNCVPIVGRQPAAKK